MLSCWAFVFQILWTVWLCCSEDDVETVYSMLKLLSNRDLPCKALTETPQHSRLLSSAQSHSITCLLCKPPQMPQSLHKPNKLWAWSIQNILSAADTMYFDSPDSNNVHENQGRVIFTLAKSYPYCCLLCKDSWRLVEGSQHLWDAPWLQIITREAFLLAADDRCMLYFLSHANLLAK
jgi:hypothetical protein